MRIARTLWRLFLLLLLALAGQWLFVLTRLPPQDLPWTALDLRAPIGRSTGGKLAALAGDPQHCHALLAQAEVRFTALPPRREGATCGWRDAVRLTGAVRPRDTLTCPLAAGIDLWLRETVQPAAVQHLGSRIVAVDTFGSYACRRLYGRAEGGWSEHASANALDFAGVRLADGRRVTVARDWGNGAKGAFLHDIRDGACRLFATTLSPDYNAAHRDHLHLDLAARGRFGWHVCG